MGHVTSATERPDPHQSLSLRVETPVEGTTLLEAAGEVDMLTAPQLEDAAGRALDDAPAVLVLDLTKVTFLSSAGLSVLIRSHQRAGAGTTVRIVADSEYTLRPLQLMGLDQELLTYKTRDEALTAEAQR